MTNLSKRILACILCAMMLASVLASCKDGTNDPPANSTDSTAETEQTTTAPAETETTAETETETTESAPTFVEADFGGKTFTVLAGWLGDYNWGDNFIDNEELNGEAVNDAVIERNRAVEEKYNVEIAVRDAGREEAITAAKSGTVDFELVYDIGSFFSMDMMIEGVLYDFYQIPHIDFTREYWAPSLQSDMSVAGKMLVSTCDITMNHYAFSYFMIFNSRLLDEYGLEAPYDLIESNQWTVDNFFELVVQCGTDVNSDGIWDTDDIYGTPDTPLSLAVNGANMSYVTEDEDGSPILNIYVEELEDIYNKYNDYVLPDGVYCWWGWKSFLEGRDISAFENEYHAARALGFGGGRRVFDNTPLKYVPEYVLTDDQYGILPNPKLNPEDEYSHYINNQACMFVVMKQADMEFVGTVMEYMAYESHERVFPAFYKEYAETKNTTKFAEQNREMLDIVFRTSSYGGGWEGLYCCFGGVTQNKDAITSNHLVSEMLATGNFKDTYAQKSADAQATIDEIYDFMLEYDSEN